MSLRSTSIDSRKTRYGVTCRSGFTFTLIEVMVVLAIVMLLVTISFNFIGRLPAGLLLQSTAANVDDLLASARNRALFQSKRIDISFNTESNALSIGAFASAESGEFKAKESTTFDSIKRRKGDKYVIPSDVTVEFSDRSDDAPVFRFFPDGTAAGGEMRIAIKERVIVITVSKLTGIVSIKEEAD